MPLRQGFSAGNTQSMVPQSRALPVLITRPDPQGQRFAQDLKARFGDRVVTIATPLLHPVWLEPRIPDGPFGAVVLTSETGARAAGRLRGFGLPKLAFCVGARTAAVATEEGFHPLSAEGDAQDLLQLLIAQRQHAPFLHLRGRESRGDVVEQMQAQGIPAAEAVVYAQDAAPLSPEAVAILSSPGLVAVPLFSPRTASLFRAAVAQVPVRARLALFAMSAAVAAEVQGMEAASLHVAAHPTQRDIANSMAAALFLA